MQERDAQTRWDEGKEREKEAARHAAVAEEEKRRQREATADGKTTVYFSSMIWPLYKMYICW